MKKPRKVRVVARAESDLPAIVRIDAGRKVALYAVRETPSQFGGRGFLVREIADEPQDTYQCHVGGGGAVSLCTCLGYIRWGHCKHHDGLRALIAAGRM